MLEDMVLFKQVAEERM